MESATRIKCSNSSCELLIKSTSEINECESSAIEHKDGNLLNTNKLLTSQVTGDVVERLY